MINDNLKIEIKQIWKNIFNDSDEYINIIVEDYINNGLIEYEKKEGRIVAIICGKVYNFNGCKNEFSQGENKYNFALDSKITGVYLCGLATLPEYRGNGVMSRLLERMENRCKKEGYAFTFLIPANEGLNKFYRDRKYVNAFKRNVIRYTSVHNFMNEIKDKSLISEYKAECYKSIKDIDNAHAEEIVKYIIQKESELPFLSINHTENDLKIILEECFISGGNVWIIKNNEKVCGFCMSNINENNDIIITKIFTNTDDQRFFLLTKINEKFKDNSIKIYTGSANDNERETERYYVEQSGLTSTINVVNKANSRLNYGMIKLLNPKAVLDNIKLCKPNINFSYNFNMKKDVLLISFNKRDEIDPKYSLGTCEESNKYSFEELAEILWRNELPHSDDPFILPRLDGNIFWMLD